MWMSQPELCEKYKYCRDTVYKYVREMQEDREYKSAVIGAGKAKRIDDDSFQRYARERRRR